MASDTGADSSFRPPSIHPAAGSGYALGALLAVLAVGAIAASDAFAKALAERYDAAAIVFYRAVVGCAFLGGLLLHARGGPARPGPLMAAPGLQLLRGLCVTAAAFLFFWALPRTALSDAMALTATAPVFMALLGWIALGERPSPWLWPLIALGGAGVALIARPEGAGDWAPYAAIVASSGLYAAVCVLTRAMAGRDSAETTSFASYVVMALGAGAVALGGGVGPPQAADAPLIAGLGFTGALGMVLYARAYAHAGVANLAPWDNTVFLWGLALGAVAFAERPDALDLAGGALVAASGVLAAMLPRDG